jgi:Mg2+ and Co2+ transporter CorA
VDWGHAVVLSLREQRGVHGENVAQLDDLQDQFRRIAAMADSQREYLQGVIEFYQTRTGTKMTIAAERLAVIAAVTRRSLRCPRLSA